MHLFGLNWQLQDHETYGPFENGGGARDTTPNTFMAYPDNSEPITIKASFHFSHCGDLIKQSELSELVPHEGTVSCRCSLIYHRRADQFYTDRCPCCNFSYPFSASVKASIDFRLLL